jgi:hypothetical protein
VRREEVFVNGLDHASPAQVVQKRAWPHRDVPNEGGFALSTYTGGGKARMQTMNEEERRESKAAMAGWAKRDRGE